MREDYEKYFDKFYFKDLAEKEGITAEEAEKRTLMQLPRETGLYGNFHAILAKMFQVLHDICESENIPIFLMGGSCIGAVRHKYIIPWDTDGDVGIFEEDVQRFCEAISKSEAGIKLKITHRKEKILYTVKTGAKYSPGIDVFVWSRRNGESAESVWEDRLSYKNSIISEIENLPLKEVSSDTIKNIYNEFNNFNQEDGNYMVWSPKCYTPKNGIRVLETSTILPLQQVEFCDRNWNVPADYETYLATEGYDNIWKFPDAITKVLSPHHTNIVIECNLRFMEK